MIVFGAVFLHLLAFLAVGGAYKVIPKRVAQIITSGAAVLASVFSVYIFFSVAFDGSVFEVSMLKWISVGSISIDWAIRVDSLTAVMLVVVNVISALVHIYSIGYMDTDRNVPKFMSFLSLFSFFMLLLVTSNNFIQLFLGWEGVGLCSYLLIGYYYTKESACDAAVKAFVVNRVADVFFAIGIFAIYNTFGSLVFKDIFADVSNYHHTTVNILGYVVRSLDFICLMLFIGCMGKSAQIGFHVWLPDAMEGPTPVSALIHAATMVTAGVFLVVRCSPLFEYAPDILDFIVFIGGTTAFFAGTIALVQNDIKKVVAYSTCSQLGYMFLACGLSAYPAAIFHLVTHAYFKALLFLGAGSVIHAVGGEQDIRKMGGLRKKVPFTHAAMLIGSLALSGIFPLAGYFSKDVILESTIAKGTIMGTFGYVFGLATVGLTAFYSFRLMIYTFYLPAKSKSLVKSAHESPKVMLIPLVILSIGAIFSGMVGEYLFGIVSKSLEFWNGSLFILQKNHVLADVHDLNWAIKIIPTIVAVSVILATFYAYLRRRDFIRHMSKKFEFIYVVLSHKYYCDEMFHSIFIIPFKSCCEFFADRYEKRGIDHYGPNGLARLMNKCSIKIKRCHTGLVYHYAVVMLMAFILIITWCFTI